MKKYTKRLIVGVGIALSNFPPLQDLSELFLEGVIVHGTSESWYVTKDLKHVYSGPLKDSLANLCYVQYVKLHPKNEHILYRIQRIKPWQFWHWREYVSEEKWRQPYLAVSREALKKALDYESRMYDTPDGTCWPMPD